MNGYMGRILYVDLTSDRIYTEALDPVMARNFLGGWGVNARLAWDAIPPGVGLRIWDLYDHHLDVENNGCLVQYALSDGSRTSTGEFAVEDIAERIRVFGITGALA